MASRTTAGRQDQERLKRLQERRERLGDAAGRVAIRLEAAVAADVDQERRRRRVVDGQPLDLADLERVVAAAVPVLDALAR
jgi:hypothetical protein